MKQTLISIAIGCPLAFPAVSYAAADRRRMEINGEAAPGAEAKHGMSHSEMKKVDFAAGELTIKHGALEKLGMDAMTMVFKVNAPEMLLQVKAGDQIDFVAEEVNGTLTIIELKEPRAH